MLKKTLKFTGFDGVEVEQDFYFHLPRINIVERALHNELEARIKRMIATSDGPAIMREMTWFVENSLGRRSDDNKLFMQTDEDRHSFRYSSAWDTLMIELITKPGAAEEFIKGILPSELTEALKEKIEQFQNKAPGQPTEDIIIDERPAWIREGREPTKKEMRTMTREQLLEVFEKKNASK